MPMLEEARIKAEADETELYVIRADASEMPFFSGTFGGLVMGGTLNELSEQARILYECRRTLKKGGTLIIMTLNQSDRWVGRMVQAAADWSGLRFFRLKESRELFERTGFQLEEQYTKSIVSFTRLCAV